jgi:hypothetical protein
VYAGRRIPAVALGLAMLGYASFARAQATIKVGVLHSLSVADTKPLVGHLAVWNYSQSIKNTTNEECIQK